jgi:hypothetical protein
MSERSAHAQLQDKNARRCSDTSGWFLRRSTHELPCRSRGKKITVPSSLKTGFFSGSGALSPVSPNIANVVPFVKWPAERPGHDSSRKHPKASMRQTANGRRNRPGTCKPVGVASELAEL